MSRNKPVDCIKYYKCKPSYNTLPHLLLRFFCVYGKCYTQILFGGCECRICDIKAYINVVYIAGKRNELSKQNHACHVFSEIENISNKIQPSRLKKNRIMIVGLFVDQSLIKFYRFISGAWK